jgi:hypothetical protein
MKRTGILNATSVAICLVATMCTTDPPVFYNPANGAITECVASDLDPFLTTCKATYKRAGWVEVTGPIIGRETPPTVIRQ